MKKLVILLVTAMAACVSVSDVLASPALVPMPRQVLSAEARVDRYRKLPPEGYVLRIGADGAYTITAVDEAGRFYAEKTLEQLRADAPLGIPEPMTIVDWPQFRWRGIHVDESRHFFGKLAIKREGPWGQTPWKPRPSAVSASLRLLHRKGFRKEFLWPIQPQYIPSPHGVL